MPTYPLSQTEGGCFLTIGTLLAYARKLNKTKRIKCLTYSQSTDKVLPMSCKTTTYSLRPTALHGAAAPHTRKQRSINQFTLAVKLKIDDVKKMTKVNHLALSLEKAKQDLSLGSCAGRTLPAVSNF